MVRYRIKKLIDGWRIDKKYGYLKMIAIPRISGAIECNFDDDIMYINDWEDRLEQREFQDKLGRYSISVHGYFIWKPSEKLKLLDLQDAAR